MLKGKIPILVAAVVAIISISVAVVAVVRPPFGPFAQTASAEQHKEEIPAGPGPQYVLKERILNLADSGSRRYLKIAASIEFTVDSEKFKKASGEGRKELQKEFDEHLAPWIPLIDDTVLTLASARAASDLSTAEGKTQLKNDIKTGLNRLLGGEQVGNVHFTQFVIQ